MPGHCERLEKGRPGCEESADEDADEPSVANRRDVDEPHPVFGVAVLCLAGKRCLGHGKRVHAARDAIARQHVGVGHPHNVIIGRTAPKILKQLDYHRPWV